MLGKVLVLIKPYKKAFIIGQMAMIIGTLAGLAFPWTVREVFNSLFQAENIPSLMIWVGLLASMLVLTEVANYVKTNALDGIGQNIICDLRDRLYQKLLELSLDYYDHQTSGEITSRLTNDINLVQSALSSGLTYVLQQIIALIGVTILLIRLDPLLTVVVFGTTPFIILISKAIGNRIKTITQTVQERLAALTNIISESVLGIDTIKAFVLEHYARGLFRDENERVLFKSLQSIRVTSAARLTIGLLNSMFTLLVIGLGSYRVMLGRLTPSDLIAFILYSEMVAGPVVTLAGIYVEVNKSLAAFKRIDDILSAPVTIRSHATFRLERNEMPPVQGRIEFRDVAFSYNGQRTVLHNINLTIEPGERIALVGPSGAGKSTLIKLLPRFYDPTAGCIYLDGVNIRDIDLEFLRRQIAIVPQDIHLFGMSIYENIACGRPDASEEEIVRAARLANAHEFIIEQPEGYHTLLGEHGARLSGGQRQRLAIARAFLRDPRILILDEATSALDAYAEQQIQNALDKLIDKRTTLIIAHRLSTVQKADRIVVLDRGRIVAIDTHQRLLATCTLYRDLYRSQFAPQVEQSALQTVCPTNF